MNRSVYISLSERSKWNRGANSLPPETLSILKRNWPGTIGVESVFIEGDPDDESVRKAVLLAKGIGKVPKLQPIPSLPLDYQGPLYNIRGSASYEPADFAGVEYFVFSAGPKLATMEGYKYPDGTREKLLDGKSVSKKRDYGFIAHGAAGACKEAVRADIEAQGFTGWHYIELAQKPVSNPYVPVYRFCSTLRMPPVLNPIFDEDGNRCEDGDYTRGCWPDNTVIPRPLYYDEAAVRAMEPFDCAWTAEAFGLVARGRRYIVSRRFLDFLDSRKLKYTIEPVYLRADGKAPEPEPLFPWLEEAAD